MATLNAIPVLSYADLYSSFLEVPGGYTVGTLAFGSSGKAFRLVLNGAVLLIVGNVLQSSILDANFDALGVPTATVAGATTVVVTNGATAVLADQFDGGTMQIGTSSTAILNLGEEYTILGHSVVTNGVPWSLYLDRPLRNALTVATTTVNVRRSPWSGVIQAPVTTQTGTIAGICIYPIPASTATVPVYGWVQTKGVGSVLSDASAIIAGSAVRGGLVAGACSLGIAGWNIIGQAMKAANSTHSIPVQLCID